MQVRLDHIKENQPQLPLAFNDSPNNVSAEIACL